MLQYLVSAHTQEGSTLGKYNIHGIRAVDEGNTLDEISDISFDKEAVQKLATLLNEGQASAVHFRDIVQDYIAEL